MNLRELICKFKYISTKGNIDIDIENINQKATTAKNKNLFFCFKGVNFDGHEYANEAIENGAVALVVERFLKIDVPQILVKDARKFLPKICNKFFSNILSKIKLIGVTGTNGKTTTCTIIYNILVQSGIKTGLIGTNGICYCDKKLASELTTPDTVDFFYLLDKMKKSGVKVVVMEVSAHALSLNKLYGLKFEIGVFTNLTQDHLDFFKTMHNYALAKLKFLKRNLCKKCVINVDDNYGQLFCKLSNSKVFTYSIKNPSSNFAMDLDLKINGSKFLANICDNIFEIKTNLPCLFNVYNILAAMTVCKLFDTDNDIIVKSLNNMTQIDGRMNFYKLKNGANVIIDFAHTPDGLEKVLENLNSVKNGNKIITVFGCGGNRDKTKRPIMSQIAEFLSDFVIITSDNPRFEDPEQILKDIEKGFKFNNYRKFVDRTKAIEYAISVSKSNDIILIAGKGAESYQQILNVKHPYNDKFVLEKYLLT